MGSDILLLLLSGVVSLLLFTNTTGQVPTEEEPEFLAPLENITVTQGRDVVFTCIVNHLGAYKVAWIKSDSKAILAIHTHLVAHNLRLGVTHNGHNTWKLHISNVQKNDSGTYMCQINTDPMRSQMGNLEVVIPPDILNDESSDNGVAHEGGSIRLRCSATGVPEPTVSWKREDSKSIIIRHDGGSQKTTAHRSIDGEVLTLANVQRSDMGSYLCIATNGIPPTVSKRFHVKVHFHPQIRVSNQLVAAPMGSAVIIQCYIEASPKAMNSWYKDTGEKLIDGSKYFTEENHVNEYGLNLNLTIKALEKQDLGGYVCTSVNALGKAEGVVRLQELQLAPKTTTSSPRFNINQYMNPKPTYAPKKPKAKPKKDESKTTISSRVVETINPTVYMIPQIENEIPGSNVNHIHHCLPVISTCLLLVITITS